jgi:hypothetical protein
MERLKKIVEMAMDYIDPGRGQMGPILNAVRSAFNDYSDKRAVWKEYVTFREGTSNKFHYFIVYETADGKYHAANAYGRIGYDARPVDLGVYPTKEEAISVAKKKLSAKLAKGYAITKV